MFTRTTTGAVVLAAAFSLGLTATACFGQASGFAGFALDNGDTNGDFQRDVTDPVYLLSHLFLGGDEPVPLALCAGRPASLQNGDVNADGSRDISDAQALLNWLFLGGAEPADACSLPGETGSGVGDDDDENDDGDDDEIGIVPLDERVRGKTYGDWVASWWQWATAIPASTNPILDETGEFCDVGQAGKVWFLAGSFGDPVTRTCVVPKGKYLFFPIINTECSSIEPPPFFGGNEAELLACNDVFYSDSDEATLTLDGVNAGDLTGFRVQSPLFEFTLAEEDDIFGFPGQSALSVGDGYYIMLEPLDVGKHTLHFSGKLGGGPFAGFSQDVTYNLLVVDQKKVRIVPPDRKAFGKTYGEWGGLWWDWGLQFPTATNPILDETGEFCDLGQEGKVWFLAGSFGTAVTRTCTVPKGKAIFFPILNSLWWVPEDGATEAEVRALANASIDPAKNLSVTIDGIHLEGDDLDPFRAESPPGGFVLHVVPGSILEDLGFAPGPRDPAVADGFWIMLAPLPEGDHLINFTSQIEGNPDFDLDVTYDLTIVDLDDDGDDDD